MENDKKGTEEKVEEKTTEQEVPPVEEKKSEEDEGKKVEVNVADYDTLQKKAADFDGMVEKNRLKKLASKDAPKETKPEVTTVDMEEVKQAAAEAGKTAADARIQEINKSTYEENLSVAYKIFISKNKWANTDKHIAKISETFKRGDALTSDELLGLLDKAALENYPKEYTKSLEDKARSKVLAEESNIQAGGSGGTGVPAKDVTSVDINRATPEDIRIAEKFFGGDVARYLKTKETER